MMGSITDGPLLLTRVCVRKLVVVVAVLCSLLPVVVAFTRGSTNTQTVFGSMSAPSRHKRPTHYTAGRQVNNNENRFTTTELEASSLFLDIPDLQTLQAAAAVISSGLSAGVGVSLMMDRAAAGFRRRFFVRKQIVDGTDPSEVPRDYRIPGIGYDETTATTTTPSIESSYMKTTEELRRLVQERKKKLELPNLLFSNNEKRYQPPVNTNVNSWSPPAPTTMKASPPAPATASFLEQPSAVPYTPTFAPVPVSSGANYLQNIGSDVASTTGIKKKFYGPSKWSPGKASTTAFAGGSSYLATMSNPSTAPANSSPPVSYGLPADIMTSTTTTTTTGESSLSGSSSYLSNMSGASASSLNPSNNGQKKTFAPSKWSPKSSSLPGGNSFAGGNSYFGTMSSSTPPVSYQTVESSHVDPIAADVVSVPTPVSFGTSSDSTSRSGPKSYAMSKWSPKSNAVSTGTGIGGYLSNMMPSDSSQSVSMSIQSVPVEPPSYDYPVAPPAMTPVSSPGGYMDQIGGSAASSSSSSPKSYSMSKWSPKSNVVQSNSMSGYLSSMQTSEPSTSSSYQAASYETPAVAAPVEYSYSSISSSSEASVSTGGNYMEQLGGGGGSTSVGSVKSYSMSKWSPKSSSPGTATGGYLSNMASSTSSSSSYQSASYDPPSYQQATSYDPPSYQQPPSYPTEPPVPAPVSSYISMPAPATGATIKKWGFKSTSGMTGSGTGYFSALTSSSPTTSDNTNANYYSESDANGQYNSNYDSSNRYVSSEQSTEYQEQTSSRGSSTTYANARVGQSGVGASSYLNNLQP